MLRIRSKLTFANIVSLTALAVALSGTAYAALSLPPNSVGTAQIKTGAVTLGKISSSAAISLKGARGRHGLRGPQGIQGSQGIQGARGIQGAAGATNVTVRTGQVTVGPMSDAETGVQCNNNEVAVGGGGSMGQAAEPDEALPTSYPTVTGGHPTGWIVSGFNGQATPIVMYAFVVCASP